MILYHFTALHSLSDIKDHGLRLGMTPIKINKNIMFLGLNQWMTSNPDFNQSWNENTSLPYDRTEVRITFDINDPNLLPWNEYKRKIKCHVLPYFDSFGDPDNWYVYQGVISPSLIRDISFKNPAVPSKFHPLRTTLPTNRIWE